MLRSRVVAQSTRSLAVAMMFRNTLLVLFVACLVGVGLSGLAYADKDDSVRIYEQGKRDYNLGNFESAITLFKAAYKEYEAPAYLYNIAQAYRQQKNCEKALFFYERFLAEKPGSEREQTIRAHVADLKKKCGQDPTAPGQPPEVPREAAGAPQQVTVPAQGAVSAARHAAAALEHRKAARFSDAANEFEQAYQASKEPRYIFHKAELLRQAGRPLEAIESYHLYLVVDPSGVHASLARHHRDELEKSLQPAVDLSTARPSGGWPVRKKWALGVGAAGVLALGAGTAFGIRAVGQRGDALDADIGGCDADFVTCNEKGVRLYLDAQDSATLANIGIGVGVVASITGIALWLTAPEATASETGSVQVRPLARDDSLGLVLTGRY